MSNPKPTLGYPSQKEAVLALRAQGLPHRTIAARIGVPASQVRVVESKAKRKWRAIGRTVMVPPDILDALAPHAARRGITVNALVRLLCEALADEGLVDAVLDDLVPE